MLGGIALILVACALALFLLLLRGSSYDNVGAIEFLLVFLFAGAFLVFWGYATLAETPTA